MVGVPFVLWHGFERRNIPSPASNLSQDFFHASSDFMRFCVQNEGVLRQGFGEVAGRCGAKVVSIDGEAYGIVDGDDLILIVLAPILNQRDIGGRFKGHTKIVIQHVQLPFSIKYKWYFCRITNQNQQQLKIQLFIFFFITESRLLLQADLQQNHRFWLMKKQQMTLSKHVSPPKGTLALDSISNPKHPKQIKGNHSNNKNLSIKSNSKPKSATIHQKKDTRSTSKNVKNKVPLKGKKNHPSKKEDSLDPMQKNKNIYTGEQIDEGYLQKLNDHCFEDLSKVKFILLGYIFKKRLIKDEQYNDLYEELLERFPDQEEAIKKVLFQIVSSLDS